MPTTRRWRCDFGRTPGRLTRSRRSSRSVAGRTPGPFSNLAFVQCFGTGADHLLADPRIPAHIPIARLVNPQQTQGMVEFVLGIVLGWHRRSTRFARNSAVGSGAHPHPLASERTVGVLGLGEIGGAVASSLAGFGFKTRGWSRSSRILPGVRTFAGEAGLDSFAGGLDCSLPAAADRLDPACAVRRIVRPAGSDAYVVNRTRRPLQGRRPAGGDRSGQLAGAWLDVFETEPLPASRRSGITTTSPSHPMRGPCRGPKQRPLPSSTTSTASAAGSRSTMRPAPPILPDRDHSMYVPPIFRASPVA